MKEMEEMMKEMELVVVMVEEVEETTKPELRREMLLSRRHQKCFQCGSANALW